MCQIGMVPGPFVEKEEQGFFVKNNDNDYSGPFTTLKEARTDARMKGPNLEIYHGILEHMTSSVLNSSKLFSTESKKMTEFELQQIMDISGFSSYSHQNNRSSFDFVDNLNIHCEVKLVSKEFKFVFVTPKWHTLSSGWASPIDDVRHFARLHDKFISEVNILNSLKD